MLEGTRTRSHRVQSTLPSAAILFYQFLVSVYGGYFGAGVGSRMAQRAGERLVRIAIIVIGLGSGIAMLAAEIRR
jgi:uncharacterized membrane protein YfcA